MEFLDSFISKLQNDPAFNQAIISLGAGLLQPVAPGQTGAGHAGQALMGSVAHLNKMREAEALAKIRERQTGAMETTANARAATADTARRQFDEYQKPQLEGVQAERAAHTNLMNAQARREKLLAELGKGTKGIAPEMVKNIWNIAAQSVGMTEDVINELSANGKHEELARLEGQAWKRFNNYLVSMGYPPARPLLEHVSDDYLKNLRPGSKEEQYFTGMYGDAGQARLKNARTPPAQPQAAGTPAGNVANAKAAGSPFDPIDRKLTALENSTSYLGLSGNIEHLKQIIQSPAATPAQKQRAAALIPILEAKYKEIDQSLNNEEY